MLPPEMNAELLEIFNREQSARGTISAKSYALALMIQLRRRDLCEELDLQLPGAPLDRITRLSAELTLLMIERGA